MHDCGDVEQLQQREVQEVEVKAKTGARTWWYQSMVGNLNGLGLNDGYSHKKSASLFLSVRLPVAVEIRADEIAMRQWHSSTLLSQLLLSVPELVYGKTVLELGAGFHGIVALSACHVGARAVLTTDVDKHAVHLCQLNLDCHQPHRANAEFLDYFRLDSCRLGHFDVVLGADLVCTPRMVEPLVIAIQRFLNPGGLAVIVCPKPIARDGIEGLERQMQAMRDLSCIMVPIELPFARAGNLYNCYTVRSLRCAEVCLDALD